MRQILKPGTQSGVLKQINKMEKQKQLTITIPKVVFEIEIKPIIDANSYAIKKGIRNDNDYELTGTIMDFTSLLGNVGTKIHRLQEAQKSIKEAVNNTNLNK